MKLKSITIVGSTETDSNPSDLKAFINRDDVDFDNADDLDPVQEWTLPERNDAQLEFPTNFAKFQNVQSLVLYFTANHGAEQTKLLFLGFRGTATSNKRQIVECVYESRAMLADHKVFKMMNFATKVMNYTINVMDFALKMMNFATKMMKSAIKMMVFVLKIMNFTSRSRGLSRWAATLGCENYTANFY